MILQQVIFKAVGITIFHSLWQGTLLVLLTFIILKVFRGMTPASKYLLLFGTSCMILITAVVTFIIYYQIYRTELVYAVHLTLNENLVLNNDSIEGTISQHLLTTIDGFISTNAKTLFYSWFAGVVLMFFWFTGGWIKTRNISRYQCNIIEGEHGNKFNSLLKSMRINNKVVFKETAKINIPALVGWLKPVILLPAGMLGNLPAAQLEAIIAHELAHLKRNDYLTNMLQQLINIFLFYHPAIWWLSSAMEKERELAADVMALNFTRKKTAYVKALTTFQEIIINRSILATAFSGKKSSFFNRIIHIINMKHMKPTIFEKSFLLVVIILGIVALIGGSRLNNTMLNEAALIPSVDLNLLVNKETNNDLKEHHLQENAKNIQEGASSNNFSAPVKLSKSSHDEYTTIKDSDKGKGKARNIFMKRSNLINAEAVANIKDLFGELLAREKLPRDMAIAEIHSNYPGTPSLKDTIKTGCVEDKKEEEMEVILQEVEKTLQEINVAKIVEESLAGIDISVIEHEALSEIDWDEIQYQIKVALEEVNEATAEIQSEQFRKELEQAKAESRKAIKKIDSDEIKRELEDARREIEKALEEIEQQRQRMQGLEQENAKRMEIEIKQEMEADSTRMEKKLKELESKK